MENQSSIRRCDVDSHLNVPNYPGFAFRTRSLGKGVTEMQSKAA